MRPVRQGGQRTNSAEACQGRFTTPQHGRPTFPALAVQRSITQRPQLANRVGRQSFSVTNSRVRWLSLKPSLRVVFMGVMKRRKAGELPNTPIVEQGVGGVRESRNWEFLRFVREAADCVYAFT